ncbi:G-protein coupled receptor GRL101-like [Physella acuta]|uniref:G-protein coupled receptor GRL101-like n=1 Tax=Physella acuta TaxID=109671 RepID=UPI0027DD2288|nr:G-protein coupled receptor GRL101-like [Physella acuta]
MAQEPEAAYEEEEEDAEDEEDDEEQEAARHGKEGTSSDPKPEAEHRGVCDKIILEAIRNINSPDGVTFGVLKTHLLNDETLSDIHPRDIEASIKKAISKGVERGYIVRVKRTLRFRLKGSIGDILRKHRKRRSQSRPRKRHRSKRRSRSRSRSRRRRSRSDGRRRKSVIFTPNLSKATVNKADNAPHKDNRFATVNKADNSPIRIPCSDPDAFHCDVMGQECVPLSRKCDDTPDCTNRTDESVETCGCLPTEFQCNKTTCIDKMQRCDRRADCDNESDEMNCETYVCPPVTHIKCDNFFCIPRIKQCDFVDDCGDGSDEALCDRVKCVGTFTCNNSQCVTVGSRCDGIMDCYDGSDEDDRCKNTTAFGLFRCPNGLFIEDKHWCDGWVDCYGTHFDEINCDYCTDEEHFRCPNKQCIPKVRLCDGTCDCVSCADENNCGVDYRGCDSEKNFICRNSFDFPEKCVSRDLLCDNGNECRDSGRGADEAFCLPKNVTDCSVLDPDSEFFYCDERCILSKYVCDGYADCNNAVDEQDCPNKNIKCAQNEFPCGNGDCIPMHQRCDGILDCHSWADEKDCSKYECPANTKRCKSGECINANYWCDYYRDCPDGSDEIESIENQCVRSSEPCKENEFRCDNGQCISSDYICFNTNTRNGCADKTHIINCTTHECGPNQFKCRRSFCIETHRVCDGVIDCGQANWDEATCEYSCPSHSKVCKCFGEEMNCENRSLTLMPAQSPHILDHLTKLHLSGNKLNLTSSLFSEKYYDKVTYLDISKNQLTEIPVAAFENMWKLTYLDIRNNNLKVLRNGSFLGLTNLKQLHVNGNKIEAIEEETFTSLSRLMALDLSGQKLTFIYKHMFKGLRKVTTLNISNNLIKYIEEGAFSSLINVVHIDMSHNMIKDIGKRTFVGLPRLQFLNTDSFKLCCLAQGEIDCTPKKDEFSSCENLMSNHVLKVSIWVLGVIAIVGNLMVIVWRVRDFRGGKVHSFLITNLAIGDFLMGIYLLIIAAADAYFNGVYITYDEEWRQSSLCQFAGFVSTFSSELSVLTLTTITLDRLFCILFPLRRSRLGLKQAVVVMSFMWFLVFWLAVLPLMGFTYFENFYGRSGVCLALHVTPDHRPGWEYSVGVFLALNLVSFLLIASSYLWMFYVAKKTRSAVRTAESKNDSAMARRMTLIVMTDFCCWVPIIVLGLVSLAGTKTDDQVYAWIAVFVLPLNSATNPVIYTLSTAPFLGNVRKRANRFRKSFIQSFTTETKHSYVDDGSSHCYCEKKSPYRQLELIRLRSLNTSPPTYYNSDLHSDS